MKLFERRRFTEYMTILENYTAVRNSVIQKAISCGRNPDDITIIAVSKTFPVSDINEAISSGIRIFGENKVQEAKGKVPDLTGHYSLHLIGHLQSNKAKDAVRIFDLIHSIDSFSTAEKVDREATAAGKVQKILIQVNTSGEESKSGCAPEETVELCTKISRLQNIYLQLNTHNINTYCKK